MCVHTGARVEDTELYGSREGADDEKTDKMAVCRSVCAHGRLSDAEGRNRGAGSGEYQLFLAGIKTGEDSKTEDQRFFG